MFDADKYGFVTAEENIFKTNRIAITEGWDWNMYNHVNLSTLYKNSTYKTGKDDNKPFKNITRPLLNLQYRSEGFDVKDIILYIDDPEEYFKSFLVRKFHDKWARANGIDTFLDELVESYVDYGGVLVKDVNQSRPEVVPLQRLAFCDQTDLLGGPICEKHFYTVDQLREMKKQGWQNIDEVILLSKPYKKSTGNERSNNTPGKYIEVYEMHGTMPDWWIDGTEPNDELTGQIQIITFYRDDKNNKHGVTLFSGKEKELPYKALQRDKIYGRALGLGGAEELFEPQVWTNDDVIRIKEMLDTAAKVIFQTSDSAFANRNRVSDVENGEILIYDKNETPLSQVPTTPVNMPLFERSIAAWEDHAQQMSSAGDAGLGDQPASGTPFRLQALVVQQGQAIHEYRRGKIAIFVEEVYRDWILPNITREMAKGTQFLSELSLDELQYVADALVTCQANDLIKEKILSGEVIDPQQIDQFKQQAREQFMKTGNKKFIEIFKNEMKDLPTDVEISIKGKQKDLASFVDSLSNVFKTIFANPAILQDPVAQKLLNEIMEASGLEPVDLSGSRPPPQQQLPQQLPVAPQTINQPQ